MKDQGNAVLAGVVNIAMATLVTLSVLGLAMAGYYSLAIRDAAIDAASRGARYQAPSQKDFFLRRLDISIPELANLDVRENRIRELNELTVTYSLPGLGLIGEFLGGEIRVAAANERL